jgi:MoaA/NifB/PqqE/SkfB family radical SAM enzyme
LFAEIDAINPNVIKGVQFTGGETTIRQDYFQLLDYAHNKGLFIEVQTNGRAFYYEEFAEKSKKYGLNHILLSFHAHTSELYNTITGVDGYRQLMKALENIKKYKITFNINLVINHYNVNSLSEIALHHSKLGASVLQFTWVRPQGKSLDMTQFPKYSENIKNLYHAIDQMVAIGQPIVVIGVPLCILGKYQKFNGRPYTDLVLLEEKTKPAEKTFNDDQKELSKKCTECRMKNICGGPYSKYLEFFGDDELKTL